MLPSERDAIRSYRASGGTLREFSPFGKDPLAGHMGAIRERTILLERAVGDGSVLFQEAVNRDYRNFQRAIAEFIRMTHDLESQI